MSAIEERLDFQIRALRLPEPEREYRFAAHHVGLGKGVLKRIKEAGLRDWRFDFAWPDLKFAVEIEGGGYVQGRHTRGKGFANDMIKYHEAMNLGWNIYRCDEYLVSSGRAVSLVEQLLKEAS